MGHNNLWLGCRLDLLPLWRRSKIIASDVLVVLLGLQQLCNLPCHQRSSARFQTMVNTSAVQARYRNRWVRNSYKLSNGEVHDRRKKHEVHSIECTWTPTYVQQATLLPVWGAGELLLVITGQTPTSSETTDLSALAAFSCRIWSPMAVISA